MALPRVPRGSVSPWAYALALAWWASSWNLQHSVLMTWLPVDPVWLGATAVALCVVHRVGRPLRVESAALLMVPLLVIGFLPGALNSGAEGYGPVKVRTLIFVLLPIVCATVVLLDSTRTRRAWVWSQTLVGVSVTVAALKFHDDTTSVERGRFALQGLDTITTARLIGAAVVVMAIFGLTSLKRCWWSLPLSAASGLVLVHVGSRGPLLFVLVTLVLVVTTGLCFAGRRLVLVLGTLAIAGVAYVYALSDGGSGGQRIVTWVQSGLSDAVRAKLFSEAIRLGGDHPMGIGWGDFAQDSKTGHEIANAQGVAYAHNAVAEAFAEGGVLAAMAFVVVMILALHRLHRLSADPTDTVVLGTLVYWLLNAQVSSDFVGNRFMWVSLAAGVAAYADGRRRLPGRTVTDVILPPPGVEVEQTAGHRVAEQPA